MMRGCRIGIGLLDDLGADLGRRSGIDEELMDLYRGSHDSSAFRFGSISLTQLRCRNFR